MTSKNGKTVVFIAMPFGERTGYLHHSEEDPTKRKEIKFDAVWKEIIEKSLPDDVEAIRADELQKPGLIDRKYMRYLLEADVVVADLTFANPNVYYEVGIRQALNRAGTVLVACEGTVLPFDLRNQTVHYYPYDEAPSIDAYRNDLRKAILSVINDDDTYSPVHTFLPELKGGLAEVKSSETITPKIENLIIKLKHETTRSGVLRLSHQVFKLDDPTTMLLENLGIKLRKVGEIDLALEAFEKAIEITSDDPEVLREIGFCYRKKGPLYYDQAEIFLNDAIALNPYDFEALGMLGGLAKRKKNYITALSNYEAAHALEPNELYPLVTLGSIHAALGNHAESKRYYSKCNKVAENKIESNSKNYWAHMCKGESIAINGEAENAIDSYKKAIESGVPKEDLVSALEQLQFLSQSGVESKTCEIILDEIESISKE